MRAFRVISGHDGKYSAMSALPPKGGLASLIRSPHRLGRAAAGSRGMTHGDYRFGL